MNYDQEFRLESVSWLLGCRGPEFLCQLHRLVNQYSPDEVLRRVIHPTMSNELIEVHAAAIEHIIHTPQRI